MDHMQTVTENALLGTFSLFTLMGTSEALAGRPCKWPYALSNEASEFWRELDTALRRAYTHGYALGAERPGPPHVKPPRPKHPNKTR